MNREKTLIIRTPEGIVFHLALANPINRFLALAIDMCCIYILSLLISIPFGILGLISMDLCTALSILASFIISLGYPIASEWYWRGQTVGKKIMRLQVIDEQGLRLQFSQVAIRNIMRFIDMIPYFYFVGGLTSLISTKGQRIGDIVANTIVIYHPKVIEPDLDQVLPDKYNSFKQHLHLVARLRQNVSRKKAYILLQALTRRELLDHESRVALFAKLRKNIEQIVLFPSEITEGISDEQFIRNIIDILFMH